eukprot:1160453-Pelagomonas_calceolata.AAC.7
MGLSAIEGSLPEGVAVPAVTIVSADACALVVSLESGHPMGGCLVPCRAAHVCHSCAHEYLWVSTRVHACRVKSDSSRGCAHPVACSDSLACPYRKGRPILYTMRKMT